MSDLHGSFILRSPGQTVPPQHEQLVCRLEERVRGNSVFQEGLVSLIGFESETPFLYPTLRTTERRGPSVPIHTSLGSNPWSSLRNRGVFGRGWESGRRSFTN